MIYLVAELQIEFRKSHIKDDCWERFKIDKSNLQSSKNIKINFLEEDFKQYKITKFNVENKSIRFCYRYENDVIFTDYYWRENYILPLISNNSFQTFTNLIFYTHAVQRHMIQIHSSMIDYCGKGLLFLGPSGIGKTTMAELWNQYRDALIINGDMNFVQDTGDEFIGWGTPWHGSSPYCENTSVPIQALIILRQASENYIRELSGFEKVQLVSNNIIYPTWLENGMELCLETLDHLLTKLPVYELSCRPDEDAVKLTEETIFGK